MHLRAIVEYDKETGSYAVWCPELPGCTSCGDTEESALQNIKEAIALYLEPADDVIDKNLHVHQLVL